MFLHLHSIEEADFQDVWLTIGSYDGVHRGHQEILRPMVDGAHRENALAVVVTFHPHPAVVLKGKQGRLYLTLPEERADLFRDLGVDVVITHPFTFQLSQTSAQDFLNHLQEHLG